MTRFSGQTFLKVAKLRRSMYGFCTRMNDSGSSPCLARSCLVKRTFSPVFVDWFSIRMLVRGKEWNVDAQAEQERYAQSDEQNKVLQSLHMTNFDHARLTAVASKSKPPLGREENPVIHIANLKVMGGA